MGTFLDEVTGSVGQSIGSGDKGEGGRRGALGILRDGLEVVRDESREVSEVGTGGATGWIWERTGITDLG